MLLKSGLFVLIVVFVANSNFFAKLATGLSAKTFRRVTSPQFGDVTLCSADQPYKVMSVSDIILPMSGLTPGIPPHVICSQGCTGEQGCTGFNYKQDVEQCHLYNNIATICTVQQACSHYSMNWTYACLARDCVVNALSWGGDDTSTSNGYIAVGGNSKTTNGRGFNFVELDVSKCSMSDVRNFDTCSAYYCGPPSLSTNMATYINSLPASTVLIGVTADEPSSGLETNGKTALLSIGVDAAQLAIRGKLAFVAQVGRPALTVRKMGPAGGNNVKITVNVRGGGMLAPNVQITQLN